MKIIDILNKMANGTLEDGFKFNYDDDTYYYNKEKYEIVSINHDACLGNYYKLESILNDEVEVIEEKKKIEELHEYKNIGYSECDIKINREKLNEVIREVNKINKDLEKAQTLNIEIDEKTINDAIKKAGKYLEREEK